jgi:neutral peptidase B
MVRKLFAYTLTALVSVSLCLVEAAEESQGQNAGNTVVINSFGENSKKLSSDEAITSWLGSELKDQLGLAAGDGLVLSERSATINNYSIRSVQQTHQGIPVIGYESRLVLDAQGNQINLLGQHQGFTGTAPTQPQISVEQALELADITTAVTTPDAPVYYELDDELRLSWVVSGYTSAGSAEKIYVDASNGEILTRLPVTHSALNRIVRNMEAACRAMGVDYPIDNGTSIDIQNFLEQESSLSRFEGDSASGVGHVDELYQMLGDAYQFINNIYGMDSLDDQGLPIEAYSGIRFYPGNGWSECVGDDFNASWYGDWNELHIPASALPYVEVIAHELGHGIVSNGAGLQINDSTAAPGALNEALGDVIGVSFRAWRESGGSLGSSLDTVPEISNWWEIRWPFGIMRNMRNPQSADPEFPDHFDDYLYLPIERDYDWGGLHYNNSIINQAFYILVEGGRHPRLGTGPNVQGIGLTDASKIFALAAANTLTQYSDFEAARYAFAMAAQILYDEYSPQWVAVHEAMDAVGLPGTWQRSAPTPPPVITPTPVPQTDPTPAPTPDPTPVPTTPEPEPSPGPVSVPMPEEPSTPVEVANNNALYIGLGLAFLALAIFGLSRLRPDYSNVGPEYRRAATPAPAVEPEVKITPQQVAVSRSRIVGRLVGSGSSSSIELDEALLSSTEGLAIGRSSALNHVILNDSRISRRHLRLRKEGHIVVLEDLNSTHGTSVNGNKLQPFAKTVLNQGDSIEIAGIQFTCDLSA